METTYPSELITVMTEAIKDGIVGATGALERVDYHSTAMGSRAVVRDLGSGREYEICVNVLNRIHGRVRRRITDCETDGCGECDVCKRLNFLEWGGQVASRVPHSIEQDKELDAYIKEKYGV